MIGASVTEILFDMATPHRYLAVEFLQGVRSYRGRRIAHTQ